MLLLVSKINELRRSWNSMKEDPSAQEKTIVQGTASAFFCQQFYENLLGEYPELKVLFPSIKGQASSMAGILSLVISQLENLQRVHDILTSLGKRHSRIIGVEVTHYELVGNALIRTLQDRCGDKFTIELENAWIKLYSFMANLMLQAGEDPTLQQQQLQPVLTPASSMSSLNTNLNNNSNNIRQVAGSTSHPNLNSPNRKPMAHQSTATMGKGYNPANSRFKAKGKGNKNSKGDGCTIM